jgi:hypothetical protein
VKRIAFNANLFLPGSLHCSLFVVTLIMVSSLSVNAQKRLSFSPSSISFSVIQDGIATPKTSTLSSTRDTPPITLSKPSAASWLILPSSPAIGTLSFSINSKGLAPGIYNAIVTASSKTYQSGTLSVTLEVKPDPSLPTILFANTNQKVEVQQGAVQTLLEFISTSNSNPVTAKLKATASDGTIPNWVSVNGSLLNNLNYTTGSEITFTFDATNLSIGTHLVKITAASVGYNTGVLNVTLSVVPGSTGTLTNIKVNFQDAATIPPTGYLRDYGQAFGLRSSTYQGTNNVYGWVRRSDRTPLDMTLNGRRRSTPSDILLATLLHMQGNHISNFSGTSIEGVWEAQVVNGVYDITVSVGDGTAFDSKHTINVEGVPAIVAYIPTSAAPFKSSTISVSVSDGLLTVDAIGGTNTKINYIIVKPSTTTRPSVIATTPESGSVNVSENASISTSILNLPNGGINNLTITGTSVYLTEDITNVRVSANVNGTGGGDAITLVPSSPLKLNTRYSFHITDGVKDLTGASFIPYSSSFTTTATSTNQLINVKFNKVELINANGRHSSLTLGPDGKLYALSIDGVIKRFLINPDGTLEGPELIYSLQDATGTRQQRLAVGLAFAPNSTATNLVAYVTHSSFMFLNGPDWDGKLTRLSGSNLQTVQDILINLPRSAKDHLTNSIAFGPDGALYFTQGSNSAMGKADATWNNREEHLLSAAVLRLDLSKLTTLPLNVKTSDGGGTYNPYSTSAALTIYASGVRNAYDLVWHTNGKLYVPANGSAAGGNTPASVTGRLRPDGTTYSGPSVPALTNVQQTQKDFLFRVEKGGYYGHPNPLRGEFAMNGANPTTSIDPAQVDAYPLGTRPDVNYRGISFDFQANKSPNGAIEYRSNSFGGALQGKLLVVRYSQHDDIITLTPGGTNNDIISYNEGSAIQGFSGFIDPLDIVEDRRTGNLYVSEYGGDGKITLLQPLVGPTAGSGAISVSPSTVYDNQPTGSGPGVARTITITNSGTGSLTVSAISITGTNAAEFVLSGLPALPLVMAAQQTATFKVSFDPTTAAVRTANISVSSNDPAASVVTIPMRGLGTTGLGGANEPSLQSIFSLYQQTSIVGDDAPSTTVIHSNTTTQASALLGEEISLQKFVKAGTGPVTIEPLAVFGPSGSNPVCNLGWYPAGNSTTKTQLLSVSNNPLSNAQTVQVNFTGILSFDPGSSAFGFYSTWPFFSSRQVYTEDALNTFTGSIRHHARIYPYKTSQGIVANAYIVCFEESTSALDYQDLVFVVRNVKSSSSISVTNSPVADAYTRNGAFASQNFGGDTILGIKGSTSAGVARVSHLKFELKGVADVITAKLRLYGRNAENTLATTIAVFANNNDAWTEQGITLNNAPARSGKAIATFNVDAQPKFVEVDVTAYVKAQFAGDKIASFILTDTSNQNRLITFNSRENIANPPQLILNTSDIAPPSGASLFVENMAKFPANDLFIASRIHFPWTRDTVEPKIYNKNHDTLKIRIHNKGAQTLVISKIIRSNTRNWKILSVRGAAYDSATAYPINVTTGTFADVWVQFIEPSDLAVRVKPFKDLLYIISNDEKNPSKMIYLNGMWQRLGEGSREPRSQEMLDIFGFKSSTGFTASDPDQGNPQKPKGDEIISTYFVRADATRPVTVVQMAAYHGCCRQAETLRWYAKTSSTPVLNSIVTHIAVDGQSLLPRKGSTGQPGDGSFSPAGPFGFKVGGADWTDTLRNPGRKIGIRVWKAKDAAGRVIPNEYIIANDYLGSQFTNYDYNDNLYYVRNIRPELGTSYNSQLIATPSAVDFGEKVNGSANTLSAVLKNAGITYSNGSSDPSVLIQSVRITGDNADEFSVSMPATSTLNAQQSTTISIQFLPKTQGLKNADLLVAYNSASSPLRIPLYGIAKASGVTVVTHHRIKSGSTTSVVVNGKTWSAETGFAFDNLEPFTNPALTTISCSDEDVLYLREQSSNGDKRPFNYKIRLPNGSYHVRLHFAEIYWGAPGAGVSGGAGSRVMNISLENQLRISNLDVAGLVGPASALVKDIPVNVTGDTLNINFAATVNRPMVCAVEVYSFSTATASASMVSMMSPQLDANASDKVLVYPNPLRNRFYLRFPSVYNGDVHLTVTDIRGRKFVLGKYALTYGGSVMEVDIAPLNLRPGTYFLSLVYDNRKSQVVKLVVQ